MFENIQSVMNMFSIIPGAICRDIEAKNKLFEAQKTIVVWVKGLENLKMIETTSNWNNM